MSSPLTDEGFGMNNLENNYFFAVKISYTSDTRYKKYALLASYGK